MQIRITEISTAMSATTDTALTKSLAAVVTKNKSLSSTIEHTEFTERYFSVNSVLLYVFGGFTTHLTVYFAGSMFKVCLMDNSYRVVIRAGMWNPLAYLSSDEKKGGIAMMPAR
jgi:hypothetical protein